MKKNFTISLAPPGIKLLFLLFSFIPVVSAAQTLRHGNSYVNISKKTIGGVVENGDTLEIRMTIHVTAGTAYRVRYLDSVPTNTQMLTGLADSIRIITNEGITYKKYTLAAGDDAATYNPSPLPGDYHIRLNIGLGTAEPGAPAVNSIASVTNTVDINSSQRPRVWNGTLFATAFRVVVTGNTGDIIRLGAGKFVYTNSDGSTTTTLTVTPYQILVSDPMSLCTDNVGSNFAGEDGGTFGLGTDLHRSYGPTVSVPGYSYRTITNTTQGVGDGEFSIVKNMSPTGSDFAGARRVPNCNTPSAVADTDPLSCRNRMHNGHWDIAGDHTGTTDQNGNSAPALPASGGYMLMVNSDYVASEAYRQTISGLCAGTYYEFSAWVKNICLTCGADSTATSNFLPGVNPTLTFVMNDTDRYSTGEILYEQGWIKKGFVFKTADDQTSITFSIRNNAQGGGGNDWVMDDISIATCLPKMQYSPSLTPTVCEGNALTIHDTVRSYFDNYTHYQWQRSTDNGSNWSAITGPLSATPAVNGNGEYEYVTSYTIPIGNTAVSDSGDLYRVIVATTADNLGSACQVTDGISIINLSVIDCNPILHTDFLSFNARLVNERGNLSWSTSKEETPILYSIERSSDGINYTSIGSLQSFTNQVSNTNYYTFIDASPADAKTHYRIAMVNGTSSRKKYSRAIQLVNQKAITFELVTVINPFSQALDFDISSPEDAKVEATLLDIFGKVIARKNYMVKAGVNTLRMSNMDGLASGSYIFRVSSNGKMISRKVLKNTTR